MKFLHTSDIHIGAKFLSLGTKGVLQRQQIKQTFEKVIQMVIDNNISVLIISGDLFDTPYPSETDVAFVKSQFMKLSELDKSIVITPGNHDKPIPASVWKNPKWSEISNLKLFNENTNTIYIKNCNAYFYSDSKASLDEGINPITELRLIIDENVKENPDALHIALAHGSVDIGQSSKNTLMNRQELSGLKCDYVALGDWHSLLLINSKSKELTEYVYNRYSAACFYSGSPEMIDINQNGAGNIIIGEFENETLRLKMRKVGVRSVDVIDIQLEGMTLERLITIISKNSNSDMIKVINLKGVAEFDLNIDELYELLEAKFWKLEINLEKNYQRENKIYEEGTVAYEFVKLLNEQIEKANEEEKEILRIAKDEGLKYLHGK